MLLPNVPVITSTGRLLSGQLPCGALYQPKQALKECKDFDELWKMFQDFNQCVFEQKWPEDRPDVDMSTAQPDDYDYKYLVFESVNGLGNRIVGTVSGLFYAMLTGRAFVLEWQSGDNHPARFEDIFNVSSLKFGVNMDNFATRSKIQKILGHAHARILNGKERDALRLEEPEKVDKVPEDWTFYFNEALICEPIIAGDNTVTNEAFDQIYNFFTRRVQWITSDQYFAAILKRNPEVRNWLEEKMPDGQLFARLSKLVFRPRDEVLTIVKEFATHHAEFMPSFLREFEGKGGVRSDDNTVFNIGVHIRTFTGTEDDKYLLNSFEKVLGAVHLMGKGSFSSNGKRFNIMILGDRKERVSRLHSFATKLKSNISASSAFKKPYASLPRIDKILLSDSIHDKNTLLSTGHGMVPCAQILAHKISKRRDDQLILDGIQCMRATLAELLAYSLNDVILYTGHSTFGMVSETWRDLVESLNSRTVRPSRTKGVMDYWSFDLLRNVWARSIAYWPYDNSVIIRGAINSLSQHVGRSINSPQEWFFVENRCAVVGTTEPEYIFRFKIRNQECRENAKGNEPSPGERLLV